MRAHQLSAEPLCRMCLRDGKVEPAVIADHIVEHHGDWNQFWLGELQSLCKHCHESRKKVQNVRGYQPDIGADGFPIDPNHPAYAGRVRGASSGEALSRMPFGNPRRRFHAGGGQC